MTYPPELTETFTRAQKDKKTTEGRIVFYLDGTTSWHVKINQKLSPSSQCP